MKKAILVLAVLVGLGATPSSAGDWTLRLAGAWVDTNAGFDIVEPEEEIFGAIRVGGAPGLALSIERRVGPHLGLKIAATVTSLPATFTITKSGATFRDDDDLDVVPVALSMTWHPWRAHRLDPWLGLGGAWVHFGDVRFFESEGANGDDDLGWTIEAGMDLRHDPKGRFGATIAVVYVAADFAGVEQDEPDRGRTPVDTTTIQVGLSVRLGKG